MELISNYKKIKYSQPYIISTYRLLMLQTYQPFNPERKEVAEDKDNPDNWTNDQSEPEDA